MEGQKEEPVRDLNELQNADWVRAVWQAHSPWALLVQDSHKPWLTMCCVYFPQARFWVQVMRDLRHGVKLKKVQERQYNLLPIEFQFTPYEMLMDDIRSKRYKLRKVLVSVHMYKWILGHVSIYNQNLFLNFSMNKQAWVIFPFVPTV